MFRGFALSGRGRGKIQGGVQVEPRKASTADKPIGTDLPLPERLYLPLQQHAGQPAEPVVRVGERVLKGQLLAAAQGSISAPVHASTSGTVVAITDFPAPHPSGLPTPTLILSRTARIAGSSTARSTPFNSPPRRSRRGSAPPASSAWVAPPSPRRSS